MFGGSPNSSGSKIDSEEKAEAKAPSPGSSPNTLGTSPINAAILSTSGEKRSGYGSSPSRTDNGATTDKKRRSSGVGSKASSLLASARSSLSFSQVGRNSDASSQTPLQKLGKQDPALAVPQGQHNNSAGESAPGPKSTFRVGVWEDRNKKCRRTMEDTHAFLYNFLGASPMANASVKRQSKNNESAIKDDDDDDNSGTDASSKEIIESDNGYFAIFDGHAGTFAADWCGKKLHIILEEMVRKNPGTALPELLDQTFTSVDAQLEKLPLKNSGCTAAVAVLRWEDRIPSGRVPTSKTLARTEEHAATEKPKVGSPTATSVEEQASPLAEAALAKSKPAPTRQRVLYTANVGDARIILCRSGRALRLSYDHKGSDENEGKRIANAGGLILNNRVNGVLAVTRALGDTYMKDLVTGHPYTTETVIQPDVDEFLIIACDGLWDVCSDQDAVDLVRDVQDPITASKQLVDHALSRFSTDNLSCMIVRFEKASVTAAVADADVKELSAKVGEIDKIVLDTKQKIADGATPAEGVSASNSARGYDSNPLDGGVAVRSLDMPVQEEPFEMEEESPAVSTAEDKAPKTTGQGKESAP